MVMRLKVDKDTKELENLSKSELIKAYNQIKQSRDRVFKIASHDLRSPFSGLLGLSEMLASGFEKLPPEDLKEYILTMRDSLENTYKLLENLFNWGLIERQKYDKKIETIPCKIVVEEVLNELAKEISLKEIIIVHDYDNEYLVQTNSRMLEFVLKNFISNAVKFSHRGGRVTISCGSVDKGHAVQITDEGLGISEENLKKLFSIDASWKIHGTEGETGTGLGLLASGRFAECFGAEISVVSALGKGSTFSLILPELRV